MSRPTSQAPPAPLQPQQRSEHQSFFAAPGFLKAALGTAAAASAAAAAAVVATTATTPPTPATSTNNGYALLPHLNRHHSLNQHGTDESFDDADRARPVHSGSPFRRTSRSRPNSGCGSSSSSIGSGGAQGMNGHGHGDGAGAHHACGNSSNSTSSTMSSWEEVREAIRAFRAIIPASSPSLKDFTFDDRHQRVYFSGLDPKQSIKTHTLFVGDISPIASMSTSLVSTVPIIDWKSVIDASWSFKPDRLSKEEQLLRERMRVGITGITSFQFDEPSGQIMFNHGGSLFVAQTDDSNTVKPRQYKSSDGQPRMDPKFGGKTRHHVSFVRQKDLWLLDTRSGLEKRLSYASTQPGFSLGVSEFVMQEEFHRFTGYWWSPDGGDRILAVEIDESKVDIVYIPQHGSDGKMDEFRYPRAGSKNVNMDIVMLHLPPELEDPDLFLQAPVTLKRLWGVFSLKERCPWAEYIPRLGWLPDGSSVWVQILDRSHNYLEMIKIDSWEFMTREEYDSLVNQMGTDHLRAMLNPPLVVEQSNIWINVTDILAFVQPADTSLSSLPSQRNAGDERGPSIAENDSWGSGTSLPSLPSMAIHDSDTTSAFATTATQSLSDSDGSVRFIWASERTGFRHLYLVTWTKMSGVTDMLPLTSGPWQIVDQLLHVDHRRQLVYFVAKRDTPLENHLYVVSMRRPGVIQRVTEQGFSHAITMDGICSKFFSSYSSVTVAPRNEIFQLVFKDEHSLPTARRVATIKSAFVPPPDLPEPRLFSFVNDLGDMIYGLVMTPPQSPGKRFPTLLKVYGGPHAQLVTNDYKFPRYLQMYLAVRMGYAVVMIDGRGSYNRGITFEAHLKHRMGTVEIEDQIQGLQFLTSEYGFIDPTRIAVSGWSYGGYVSLMALAQRGDIFKVAIAGAPVTAWHLYDTAYTEKYMGLVDQNAEGYRRGCVMTYVDQLPHSENRLLLVHGLIDENVHFHNTQLLMDALVQAHKPYQLQIYPNERHGIRHPSANEHFECLTFCFLRNHL